MSTSSKSPDPSEETQTKPEDAASHDPEMMNMFASVWVKVEVEEVGDKTWTPESERVIPEEKPTKETRSSRRRKASRPTKQLKCELCDYQTVYKNCLQAHMLGHLDKKPFSCEYCDYGTKYPTALQRHNVIKHPEKCSEEVLCSKYMEKIKCPFCDYDTPFKWNLKCHLRKHKLDKQFKCPHCPFETAYRHNFAKHSRVHKQSAFKCDKCPFVTKFKGHIHRHLAVIHNERTNEANVCDLCDFSTLEKWRLNMHKQRSKQEKPIKCSYCSFETSYSCEFKKHKALHYTEFRKLKINMHLKALNATFEAAVAEKAKTDDALNLSNSSNATFEATLAEKAKTDDALNLSNSGNQHKSSLSKEPDIETQPTPTQIENLSIQCNNFDQLSSNNLEHLTNHLRTPSNHAGVSTHSLGDPTSNSGVSTPSLGVSSSGLGVSSSGLEISSISLSNLGVPTSGLGLSLPTSTFGVSTADLSVPTSTLELPVSSIILPPDVGVVTSNLELSTGSLILPPGVTVVTSNLEPPKNSLGVSTSSIENSTSSIEVPTSNLGIPTDDIDIEIIQQEQSYSQPDGHAHSNNYLVNPNCLELSSILVLESNDKEKPFQCPMCNYISKFKASVQRHFQRHHTGNKNHPYKCVNCDFTTKTKDQISLHNKRSQSDTVLNCSLCNFDTAFKCKFAMHQKTHYPYKCNLCDYSCKHKHELTKHFGINHLGTGLKCRFCDYVTSRKDSLMSHETIHTKEKPYSCGYCDYTSVRKSLLDNHVKRYHRNIFGEAKIITEEKIESLKIDLGEHKEFFPGFDMAAKTVENQSTSQEFESISVADAKNDDLQYVDDTKNDSSLDNFSDIESSDNMQTFNNFEVQKFEMND